MAEQPKQMRFTEDELATIKNTFKGNDNLLKLMRKVFLPEYDVTAPIGQVIDLWLATPIDKLGDEEAIHLIRTRNAMIGHTEFQLQQLKTLANQEEKSAEEIKEGLKKNSSQ